MMIYIQVFLRSLVELQKDCECKLNMTSNAKGRPVAKKRHTHEHNEQSLLCCPASIDKQASTRNHACGRRY
jgi:hypothetical protein